MREIQRAVINGVIMKNNFIILTDTRQKSEQHILKEFDKQNIKHIRTTLKSADYMALRYDNGFIFDYSILIDTKKDLVEMAGNICRTSEHERIKREIEKAKQLGCEQFIFLIADNKIKTAEDIKKWKSKYTKVKGNVLLKSMITMSKKYGIKFIICSKKNMGKKIIKLLGGNNEL